MARATTFQKYLLPGFVFQSVVIAGGYGTGRELVEFFLSYGPVGGLLGMLGVSMVIWSLVCASTFELARMFRTREYRHFFKELLGRFWVLFEACYLVLLLIVLAVVASAAGSILQEVFGFPYLVGVLGILLAVGLLVFMGTSAIERFLAGWSFLLYAVYGIFFVACVYSFGDRIGAVFSQLEIQSGWFVGGVEYAAYNLGVVPAILFVTRHFETRREAVGAGLLAGPIAMIPALLFLTAVSGFYPEVLSETVPANFMLLQLGSSGFQILFQLVLFGTLIETGTGFIHAVNERIAGVYEDKGKQLQTWVRPALSTGLLVLGALIAQFGLTGLIAQGYGTITWGFVVVYVVPVLTLGVWKIWRSDAES